MANRVEALLDTLETGETWYSPYLNEYVRWSKATGRFKVWRDKDWVCILNPELIRKSSDDCLWEKKHPTKDTHGFDWAIQQLKQGRTVARRGWNEKGMWLGVQSEELGHMTKPFIYMHTAQCEVIPWLASQADMLEEDWELVK